jgi:hypothetical protein
VLTAAAGATGCVLLAPAGMVRMVLSGWSEVRTDPRRSFSGVRGPASDTAAMTLLISGEPARSCRAARAACLPCVVGPAARDGDLEGDEAGGEVLAGPGAGPVPDHLRQRPGQCGGDPDGHALDLSELLQ